MNVVAVMDLVGELRPAYKLTPVPSIARAIRQSAVTFCANTLAIRITLPPLDVSEGVDIVTIVPGNQLITQEITEAWLNDKPLALSSEREVAIDYGDRRRTLGVPTRIFISGLNEVTLVPPPKEPYNQALRLTIAVTPSRVADAIPDELSETYWPAIRDGAEAILLGMHGEPWADMNKAAKKEFNALQAIQKATARGMHSNTRRNKNIRYGGY